MANKRITDLTATTALSTNDYTIIDNSSSGTKKYDIGTKLNTLTNNVGTLSSLTTTDKSSLVSAINEVNANSGSGGGSGGGSSASILIVTDSNGTLNKTINEIKNALTNGIPVFLKYAGGDTSTYMETYRMSPIVFVWKYGTSNSVWRMAAEAPTFHGAAVSEKSYLLKPSVLLYEATTPTSYPTFYTNVTYATATINNGNPNSNT